MRLWMQMFRFVVTSLALLLGTELVFGAQDALLIQTTGAHASLGKNPIVRTSNGYSYFFIGVSGGTTGTGSVQVQVSPPSGDMWYDLETLDNQWNPAAQIGAAMGTNNIMHVISFDPSGAPYHVEYASGKAAPRWGQKETLDSVNVALNGAGKCAVATDANGIPHVLYTVYESLPKGKGGYTTLYYANKVGGIWNKTQIWGTSNNANAPSNFQISIGPDNIPYLMMGTKILKGNSNNPSSFQSQEVGPCYSFVVHNNGDVRAALSSNGVYANYIHDHLQTWDSGWRLEASTALDAGGVLVLSNDVPYLLKRMQDGIWIQRGFDPPVLTFPQPSGSTWDSCASRWSVHNNENPAVIDVVASSWSGTATFYWYGRYSPGVDAELTTQGWSSGVAPLSVNFVDKSIPASGTSIVDWDWDFNNDGMTESKNQNPSYTYLEPGVYDVALTVTDSNGGRDKRIVRQLVRVDGDADKDGTIDSKDNCPGVYNPRQTDLDGDRIGDACDSNFLNAAGTTTALTKDTSSERSLVDVTVMLGDGRLDQSLRVQKGSRGYDIMAVKSNFDAANVSSYVLKLYVSSVFSTSQKARVYAYAVDGVSVQVNDFKEFPLSGGWNSLDVTTVVSKMSGYGFVKIRITAPQDWFDVAEVTAEAKVTGGVDTWNIFSDTSLIDFGVVEVGGNWWGKANISNTGTGDLVIGAIGALTPPFRITSDNCSGVALPASAACSVGIEFIPTNSGSFSDILNISSNDHDNANLPIRLAGIGGRSVALHGVATDLATGMPISGVRVSDTKPKTSGDNPDDLAAFGYGINYPGEIEDDLDRGDDLDTGLLTKNDEAKATTKVQWGYWAYPARAAQVFKKKNRFAAAYPVKISWNGVPVSVTDCYDCYWSPELTAQSFTAGASGPLTKVSLYLGLKYPATTSQAVRVYLKTSLGGEADTVIAVSDPVDVTTLSSTLAWTDFKFPTAPQLVNGVKYYLQPFTSLLPDYNELWWGYYGPNTYQGGKGFARRDGIWLDPYDFGVGDPKLGASFSFKTYINSLVDQSFTVGENTLAAMTGVAPFFANLQIFNRTMSRWEDLAIAGTQDGYDDVTVASPLITNTSDYYSNDGWLSSRVVTGVDYYPVIDSDLFKVEFIDKREISTSLDGSYSLGGLAQGVHELTYERPGYERVAVSLALEQDKTMDVQMKPLPPCTLSGTVKLAYENTPKEGVAVTLVDPLNITHTAVTDAAGKYFFEGLPNGPCSVTFTLQYYETAIRSVTLQSAQTVIANVSLARPSAVVTITSPKSGAVLTEGGVTVTGTVNEYVTSVTVWNPGTINPQVTVPVINGTFSATVSLTGGGNTICAEGRGAWYVNSNYRTIDVTSDTVSLSGDVYDGSGHAVEGVTVTVTDGRSVTQSVLTDQYGRYFIYGIKGAATGTMSKPGYGTYSFMTEPVTARNIIQNATIRPALPIFASIIATPVTVESAIIAWTSDQQATSKIEYGETLAYGITVADNALTSLHTLTLGSLTPGKTYHFRVSSVNAFGYSTTSGDYTFTAPLFTAKTVTDSGNVTVMEVTGNLDTKKGDGTLNVLPRQEIAKEYFRTHPDNVDFLVILSNFDYAMPEAEAKGFYLGVKNDTQGIGQALFDNSSSFGSAGKLYGTIDLGNVTALAANPYGPKLDETISTLNHELMHRFGSYVRFKNPDGSLNDALLGRDAAHWSYLLDTQGSVMYGNGWRDNGDGTFTSTAQPGGYSPLDLYLMGMIPKEQVPPMLLIQNSSIDKKQLPLLGTTISGTARTITIDDIVAAEGTRIPDAVASAKKFNVGFLLLVPPGGNPSVAQPAVETLRSAWAGYFGQLTGGAGTINGVTPSLQLLVDSPLDGAVVTGPDVVVTGTIINSTGFETGVAVNGVPATVSGNRFKATGVPVQEGATVLTVDAGDENGLRATATSSVTKGAGNYVRLLSNVSSGTGPLEVSLTVNGSFDIIAPTMMSTGPVPVVLSPQNGGTYTTELWAEGDYTFTASAVAPDGHTYSHSVTVSVVSRSSVERLLRAKWSGLKQGVGAVDVEGILEFIANRQQNKYRRLFTAFGNQLALLNDYLRDIELVYMSDGVAKCRLFRDKTIMGQVHQIEYPVYFVQQDGVWKAQQF